MRNDFSSDLCPGCELWEIDGDTYFDRKARQLEREIELMEREHDEGC